MNQEEREALAQQAIQRLVAGLQQTTNAEQMIRSMFNRYGIEMYAAGNRNAEEWTSRMLASLPIPIVITRTIPEGEGGKEPVLAYHWQTQDVEGDGVDVRVLSWTSPDSSDAPAEAIVAQETIGGTT